MQNYRIRKPAVAGQFYPDSKAELEKQIKGFIDSAASRPDKLDVIGCILPHAGYIYSGKVAVDTVSSLNIKERVILLGPNHTGYGKEFSIMCAGAWQTPLGEVKIDAELSKRILKSSEYLEEDTLAHLYEHSLEVELPILQYFKSDFTIVPITILCDKLNALKKVGACIAQAIIESQAIGSVMLLASSDMTHYEPEDEAKDKDNIAIQSILELNEDKLMEKIRSLGITMCGYAPVTVMLSAAKLLGAKTAKLIKYQTSAEATGDKESVVGYAGIVVY